MKLRHLALVLILVLVPVATVSGGNNHLPPTCCICGDCEEGSPCFAGVPLGEIALCESLCAGLDCLDSKLSDAPCEGCSDIFQFRPQAEAPALGPWAFALAALVAVLAGSLRLFRRRSAG